MNKAREIVTWVCVFSVLFMGCSSSALIGPTSDAKERIHIYSDDIEVVVTRDRVRYVFDSPPSIVDNKIVGISNHQLVSIPLSDASYVYVTKANPGGTVLLVVGIVIVVIVGGMGVWYQANK